MSRLHKSFTLITYGLTRHTTHRTTQKLLSSIPLLQNHSTQSTRYKPTNPKREDPINNPIYSISDFPTKPKPEQATNNSLYATAAATTDPATKPFLNAKERFIFTNLISLTANPSAVETFLKKQELGEAFFGNAGLENGGGAFGVGRSRVLTSAQKVIVGKGGEEEKVGWKKEDGEIDYSRYDV